MVAPLLSEPWASFEPPECACEGTGLVIEVPDCGTYYYRAGYVDDAGRAHGEPCPCSCARAEFAQSHTCAHCGRVAVIVASVTPSETVCAECVRGLS